METRVKLAPTFDRAFNRQSRIELIDDWAYPGTKKADSRMNACVESTSVVGVEEWDDGEDDHGSGWEKEKGRDGRRGGKCQFHKIVAGATAAGAQEFQHGALLALAVRENHRPLTARAVNPAQEQ